MGRLAAGGPPPAAAPRTRDLDSGEPIRAAPAQRPSPGARLLREWNGETHVIDVLADGGFAWRGQSYRSLSEIARAITGTRWSGPRFFGLAAAAGAPLAG